MITAIILLIIGIAALLAARHINEPIVRIITYCIGAACLIIGAILLITDLAHITTTAHAPTELPHHDPASLVQAA